MDIVKVNKLTIYTEWILLDYIDIILSFKINKSL